MVTAYILIKANTGEAERLCDAVAAIEGVRDAHIVAGDVDLIGTVEVETPADVREVAAKQIQTVDGVESTETYIAME